MLLAQKSYVEGGLALVPVLRAARRRARHRREPAGRASARALLLDLLTPIAKSWPSQWCLEANRLAIQVHGGYGYTRDYNVEQFYRDNRLNPIHEGTHGIQALDLLGRKVRLHDGELTADSGRRDPKHDSHGARQRRACGDAALALTLAWQSLQEVTESLQEVEKRRTAPLQTRPRL